jgi:hypothetical protein
VLVKFNPISQNAQYERDFEVFVKLDLELKIGDKLDEK